MTTQVEEIMIGLANLYVPQNRNEVRNLRNFYYQVRVLKGLSHERREATVCSAMQMETRKIVFYKIKKHIPYCYMYRPEFINLDYVR